MIGSEGMCWSCRKGKSLNCMGICSDCSRKAREERLAHHDAHAALQAALPYVYGNDKVRLQMQNAIKRLKLWDAYR